MVTSQAHHLDHGNHADTLPSYHQSNQHSLITTDAASNQAQLDHNWRSLKSSTAWSQLTQPQLSTALDSVQPRTISFTKVAPLSYFLHSLGLFLLPKWHHFHNFHGLWLTDITNLHSCLLISILILPISLPISIFAYWSPFLNYQSPFLLIDLHSYITNLITNPHICLLISILAYWSPFLHYQSPFLLTDLHFSLFILPYLVGDISNRRAHRRV
jgi:hypothetical protein